MSLTFDQAVRHYVQENKRLHESMWAWARWADRYPDAYVDWRVYVNEELARMSMATERLHTLIELYHESEIT